MKKQTIGFLCLAVFGVAALFLLSSDAGAYDRYSENRDETNCRACHGNFRASPYISLHDGANWGDDAHDVHRRQMVASDCNTCHGGSLFPVLLDSSNGGAGFEPIGCMGCHGRNEDRSVDDGGACTLPFGCSPGAGLQQHHVDSGVSLCADCHDSADPTIYTPVGEDVPPSYYFTPDTIHPDKPSDPCNDNFVGGADGLDNDGDGLYDGSDPDCDTGCTSDADCDDGTFCNGAETCDTGTGECVPGTPVDCSDGVDCTIDSCNEGTDACDNAPDDAFCDNGQFCDGAETCDAVNDCQPGTPVNVDDGVACTDDSCDEAGDVVVNAPNDANCDDAAFCNGAETCDAVNDCQAGTPPCDPATETCNEDTDVCEPLGCTSDADCDDGAFCNGAETCNTGTGECVPGTPVNVDDGVGCTDDSCDEAGDVVVNAPNDANCDNGEFCDGAEFCDPGLDCQAGTPVNVDDGVACTDDSCDEAGDVVVNAPNDANCDDGAFCNGAETCDAVNDCQAGTPPCDPATETCNEDTDVCEPLGCTSDADCDNAAFCDGVETCDTGTGECVPGTPVDCADGVECTVDSCNEAADSCDNAPDDAFCDNGQFCDGAEFCDPGLDCQAGTPPCDPAAETCNEDTDTCEPLGCTSDADCDDGLFCNGTETCDLSTGECFAVSACPPSVDGCVTRGAECDEENDVCVDVADDSLCADGMFCNGAETCDLATGDCQAGTPVDVDDGVGCTDDSCDEVNDVVVNAPNNSLCADDGLFCTGSEYCDPVSDCSSTGDPCQSGETCNEDTDACEASPVVIDLDIAKFQVTKRVRLSANNERAVRIRLVVKNNGDFNHETRPAMIRGMKDGVMVHSVALQVSDPVGNGRTTFIESYLAQAPPGDILWMAEISDDDPDVDTAMAVTTVVP